MNHAPPGVHSDNGQFSQYNGLLWTRHEASIGHGGLGGFNSVAFATYDTLRDH